MKKLLVCVVAGILFLYTALWAQEVSNNIKGLLSKDGKIIYGNEPNSIVVIDYAQNLERVQEYLATADVPPRQVLIEARVVEVRLEREHSLGVNWALLAAKGGYKIGQYRLNSAGGTSGLVQNIPAKSVSAIPGLSTGVTPLNPFTVTIFDNSLSAVLSTIASDFDTDVLSAPRIATVNNREAEIKIIQSYPWAEPSLTSSDSSTGGVGTTTVTWAIHFEEIGITLKATPTITEDNNIAMDLLPEVSEKTGDLPLTVSSAGTNLTYNVPIIDKRSASTKVVVGSGQTLIIGGLIKNKTAYNRAKVPFVGDIPIFGYLFKSSKTTKEKIELLIFVSPTIVDASQVVHMGQEYKYGIGSKYSTENQAHESQLATALEKDAALKDRQVDELDALLRQRSELEGEVMQQEADVKQLQLKRDELIQLRKVLETRQR
jgi:type II secretory pathway component GspD/PulD (secretin)